MEGHFQMSRLTNFITKLFMKKVGIRKEVWLHCNSINLSPSISGLGIVYRGSTAIHLSYAGGCICQCCGGVQVVFGWQWWGNLELLAVKRVSEIKVFVLASTLNVNEIYKFLIIMTLRMLIWAPLLLGQMSWGSVDSLHCSLKAELHVLKSGHWRISYWVLIYVATSHHASR